MKILLVSPFLPYPPVAGGHRQIWTWLTRLARNHSIAFVGFYEREDEAPHGEKLSQHCEIVRLRLRKPTPHAYPSFAQVPRWVSETFSQELARDIVQVVRSFRPDVVQFLHSNMAQYRPYVDGAGVVVTALDIAFVSHRRRIAATRGLERLQARCEWLRMLRNESTAYSRADHVITVSQHDADVLRTVARHDRITAVPPGVDKAQLVPRDRRPEPGKILYVGHMEHEPNLDGLLYLYREIWPSVRHDYPNAQLLVAGKGAKHEIARVAPETWARIERDPSVEIADFIPDLAAAMDTSVLLAAPLRLGSGIRNKVIEAMAAGLPVVTTSLGVEGIGAVHQRDILIADEPHAFAKEIVNLFKDQKLQQRLSDAGRRLAARNHDNDVVVQRLEHALMRAAGERA